MDKVHCFGICWFAFLHWGFVRRSLCCQTYYTLPALELLFCADLDRWALRSFTVTYCTYCCLNWASGPAWFFPLSVLIMSLVHFYDLISWNLSKKGPLQSWPYTSIMLCYCHYLPSKSEPSWSYQHASYQTPLWRWMILTVTSLLSSLLGAAAPGFTATEARSWRVCAVSEPHGWICSWWSLCPNTVWCPFLYNVVC